MKTAINIYGKGGHSLVISSILKNQYEVHQFDDTDVATCKTISSPWVMGFGDNKGRSKISGILKRLYDNVTFYTVKSPTAVINITEIGEGSVIMSGSVIQPGTVIGDHVIINTGAVVDHDCTIGSFTHIAPNATLCGRITIGERTLVGAGSVVLPDVKIGDDVIIGAGSVVTKDIPNGVTVYGNPAKQQDS